MLETSRVPDSELYPVPADFAARAHMDRQAYEAARVAARETPEAFWSEQAQRLDWIKAPTKIRTSPSRRKISASAGSRTAS